MLNNIRFEFASHENEIDNETSDDYYTPPLVFEALGLQFDLDVCAPFGGVPWLPAHRSFNIIDDGLFQPWNGKVWMNPPFSGSGPWVSKFIEHGNGVALVPLSKSKWFNDLWQLSDGVLILPPNLKFMNSINESKSIFMPVCLAAIGDVNVQALRNSGLGHVR